MIRFNRSRFVNHTIVYCPRCHRELTLASRMTCDNCGLQLKLQGDYLLAEYAPPTCNSRLRKVMHNQRITDVKEE